MALKPETVHRAVVEANQEAMEIMRRYPVTRSARGPKPLAPQFEWLSGSQRYAIRQALLRGISARALAIKYGVKTTTIKKLGDLA